MIIEKNTSNMGTLIIKEIDYSLAKDIIVKNHYSHKWNTSFGKINIGVFKKEKKDCCIGVATFGNLMNPNSYVNLNSKFTKENVIELNRLWIDDCLGMNAETILLGACWKIIRNDHAEVKAVQSFADGRLGCGTIYKASNFDYYGYTESLFYENIETGETQHKVPMENTKRPDGMIKLNYQFAQGLLRPFLVKTYRYIYPLYKNVKIDLIKKEYPKYEKGLTYIEKYEHNKSLYFRSVLLSYMFVYSKEFEFIKKFILSKYDKETIINEYSKAIRNESIIAISKERKIENKYEEIISKNLYSLELFSFEKDEQMNIFDFI